MSDSARTQAAADDGGLQSRSPHLDELRTALAPRYELLAAIGAGHTGTVFRARDAEQQGEVVLKVADQPPGPARVRQGEMLLAEERLAARLDHPNVLSPTFVGRAGDFAYAVMPLLPGGTLEQRLRGRGMLSLDDAVAVLRDVAAGLDYAHAHDVVHGGLSPDKILFERGGRARIADFTLASASTHWRATPPAYAAPEQRDSHLTVTGRADQYALGIIAYEMITGNRRLDPASVAGIPVLNAIDVSPNRALRPEVPLHASVAIHRALMKDPEMRFPTASEFADTLSGKLSTEVHGLPTRRAVREERQRRPLVGPVVLALVAAGLVYGVTLTDIRRPDDVGPWFQTTWARVRTQLAGDAPDATTAAVGGAPAPFAPRVGQGGSAPTTTSGGGAQSSQPAPQPTAPPATPTAGVVTVGVDRGSGAVIIDGLPRGIVPYAGTLGNGSHTIAVRGIGTTFTPSEQTVAVRGGDTVAVRFSAEP